MKSKRIIRGLVEDSSTKPIPMICGLCKKLYMRLNIIQNNKNQKWRFYCNNCTIKYNIK